MATEVTEPEGLGIERKREWPRAIDPATSPIDRLGRDKELHDRVLRYLNSRIEASERAMSQFYARWRSLEQRIQAYIDLPEWEKELKNANDTGEPPKVVSVTIPFSYAVIATTVTFFLQTFTGRRPMFQIGTHKDETVQAARNMELVLQYNADHTRMVKHLWRFFQDTQTYGVGAMLNRFVVKTRRKTVERQTPQFDLLGQPTGGFDSEFVKERRTTYEGNEVEAVDPFMFFPDPRVPMSEANKRGEFIFWRNFEGRHQLKREEAAGDLKFVDRASRRLPRNHGGDSQRTLVSMGTTAPHQDNPAGTESQPFMQVDQGTVEIIPKELGLGEEETPQKWIFTTLNKSQIVQADFFDHDHEMHPVVVSEPYSLGHGFGQPGLADYLAPIQDALSWLFNSHIDNVRRVLNDVWVVDPSQINVADLKKPEPGKIIRLKNSAIGRDVRSAIQQLHVQDVTRSHISDMELVFRIGRQVSGIDENIMGLQDAGGRKTATEIRTSVEAAASRLSAQARIISAQAIVDLTSQMAINLQQFLSPEFYVRVTGKDGAEHPIQKSDIAGDFHFPVHDGTLPLDKVALVDVWKEIMVAVMRDPELRQTYSVPRIFEFIAELGGARNIESMRINVQPDDVVGQQAQQGNLAAAPNGPGPSGVINALQGNRSGQAQSRAQGQF